MAQSARRTPHAARMPRAARRAPLTLNRSTSAGFRSAAKCRVSEQPRPVSYGKQIFHLALLREIKANYAYVHENDFGTLCRCGKGCSRSCAQQSGGYHDVPSESTHTHPCGPDDPPPLPPPPLPSWPVWPTNARLCPARPHSCSASRTNCVALQLALLRAHTSLLTLRSQDKLN